VPAGEFLMGSRDGEFHEQPVHRVTISRPFLMASTEVTNAQYEQFDPKHKTLRGKRGFSRDDDEAVVFVSWREAAAFCKWLSEREGKPYRLPTEAEWEYACRAGTTTAYFTGDKLPAELCKSQKFSWEPAPVPLRVGLTPANPWGLFDMHGNVEEWCQDWYGPYPAAAQIDPAGYASGEMKVTRGGSHNTEVRYLRSSNRGGTLPEDKSWLIGFRVVCNPQAGAPPPATRTLSSPAALRWAQEVGQAKAAWIAQVDMSKPWFGPIKPFVDVPPHSNGPLYSRHNHCPSVTWCDNGDLLAVWFSTNEEAGRELTVLASRLRAGKDAWEPASVFFKAPGRNMTGSALWNDGAGRLLHFNGLGAGDGWADLALVLRTSTDNGASWQTRIVAPEHELRHQVVSGTLRMKDGALVQVCDATSAGEGGTAVYISKDNGRTWRDPAAGSRKPHFLAGACGGTIAGIHAGIVELRDGRLMALGRGDNIAGRMPMSLSADVGKTWTYSASPFPPISSGQRLVLVRLREGPLLFCSFSDPSDVTASKGISITDASGSSRTVFGLFAALSEDDGKTWPWRRLMSDDGPGRQLAGGGWTGDFTMDAAHAEPRGYLCLTQSPDGIIHLLSSRLHYRFNLAWLKASPPPRRVGKR
jgi:hypothetical protein